MSGAMFMSFAGSRGFLSRRDTLRMRDRMATDATAFS
jgi:hypothetical protein